MIIRSLPRGGASSALFERALLSLVLGVLLLPGQAAAEANGIRSGRFRVHPEARLEGRYDTNVYREDVEEESPTGAAYFRLLPGIRLENPNPGKIAIDGMLGLEIRQYLDSRISDEQSRLGLQLSLRGIVGHDSTFSLILDEDLRRQIEPGQGYGKLTSAQDQQLEQEVKDSGCAAPCTFTFWRNQTDVGLKVAPGGGRLWVKPGYRFAMMTYEDLDDTDNTLHELRLAGHWAFFPKTSAVLDATYGWLDYPNAKSAVTATSPFRATAGMRGLITTKLSVDLGAGYGMMLGTGDEFSGAVGRAELRYQLTERLQIKGGYRRDFSGSPLSNYYTSHGALGDIKLQVGASFHLLAEVGLWWRSFSTIDLGPEATAKGLVVTEGAREDLFINASARAEWLPNEWLAVHAGYRLDKLSTDYGARLGESESYAAYDRHQIFVGLGLTY